MTLRLSCAGPGPARLTDAKGALIMQQGGCTPFAVYTAGPFKTTSADAIIGLATDPDTHWKLALYLS